MTPARYYCPWCKASLKFPTPIRVGRLVRCPKCTCKFVAPEPRPTAPDPSEAPVTAMAEGEPATVPPTPEADPAALSPSETPVGTMAEGEAGEPMLTLEATSDEPAAEPEPALARVEESAAVPTEPAAAAAEGESAAAPVEEEKGGEPVGEGAGEEQPGPAPPAEEEKRPEPIRDGPPPGPRPQKRPMWRSQLKPPKRPVPASRGMRSGNLEESSERGWLGLRVSVLILTLLGCLCTAGAGVGLRNLASSPDVQRVREQLAQMERNPALPLPEPMMAQAEIYRKLDQGSKLAYVLMAVAPIALIGAILSLFGMGKTGGGILLATVPVPLLLRPDFIVLSTGFFAAALVSFLIGPSREWDTPRGVTLLGYALGWGGFFLVCRVLYEVVVLDWIAMAASL